jgi:ASC-1-like (ASCH) protein
MNHLVILHKPYLDLIIAGTKTVESRLSKRCHPAATRCHPGDLLYLKDIAQYGGHVRAYARVKAVHVYSNLTEEQFKEVRQKWAATVGDDGPDDPFWGHKPHALFVTLDSVEPCHIDKALFPSNLAWASAWIVGQPTEEVLRQARRA